MTTKDTPIHQFLFPQGMPRSSVSTFLPNIVPELKNAVEADIQKTSESTLAMTPLDVILQGWKRHREVGRALEDSRKKPTEPILKALFKHTIKSTHKPYVEIFLDEVRVGKMPFELLISFDVEGVTLKILNGAIVSIMSGSFQGAIKLSLIGETLAEVKTRRIELPGSTQTDSKATQPMRRKSDPSGARLVGLNGVAAGQSFLLADGQIIGRAAGNSIVIEDKSVSRQHARLRSTAGRWYIEDMNSSMGIFVNDEKVDTSPLKDGDRIRLGTTEFEFRD